MASAFEPYIDPLVDDYLHGVLSDAESVQFEEHCATCPRCAELVEEGRALKSLLTATPPSEASEALVVQSRARLEQSLATRRRRWNRLVGTVMTLTTAAVLLIGAFHIFAATARPTPYDLRILGQQDWLEGSYATVRVAVYDREDGVPMSGVPVELSLESGGESVSLARFETSGKTLRSPRFRVPKGGGDKLVVTAYPNGRREVMRRHINTRRAWKLMLSTDKPVYQPGQTIHMRAIGLQRPNLEPMAGQEAVFTITDPKGNVIFRQTDVSTEYGIVSTDCPMATEIIEGAYELECRIGSTTSNRTVTVEKYVLPKFKVAISCDQPFYAPRAEVSGSVQADYFFGEPVSNARVVLQAFTTDVEPVLLHFVNAIADAKGKMQFRFRLPETLYGREQSGGDVEFQLFATVKDTAGQSATNAISRLVTSQPLRVEIIPESGTLVRDAANRVFVFTSSSDGRPTPARLAITGVTETLTTNAMGVTSFELTPKESSVALTVKATSVENPTLVVRQKKTLECGGVGDYLLRPNKAVYRGGETMQLTGFGAGVEPIFVDLLKDGQCVFSETVEMQDGQGTLELDLPDDLFGTIRMVTYRLNQTGLPYRKSRTLFIDQANEIQIDAQLDRTTYRPGESATLTVKLTDADGQPQPGAISLAAVDEAVFSVLNQSAGVERIFFLLEKEMLEPVYTIYPWAPPSLESQSPQQAMVDQALLSLTSSVDAGTEAVPTRFAGKRQAEQGANRTSSEPTPFTLHGATYRGKMRSFKTWQNANLRLAEQAWWWLMTSLIATAGITFTVYRPKWSMVLAAGSLPIVCIAGMAIYILQLTYGINVPTDRVAMATRMEAPDSAALEFSMPQSGMGLDDDVVEIGSIEQQLRGESQGGVVTPPRLREYFPETLLWRPELVTDDAGVAKIEIPLADSITTWRLSGSAVAAGGQLGSIQKPLQVFQPFFVDFDLPVSLTRHDTVGIPLVVYNYLDEAQTVELEFVEAGWFERLTTPDTDGERPPEPPRANDGDPERLILKLAPGEVRSLSIPIRVLEVGRHAFQVTATSGEASDAIRREIDVIPNGKKVEVVLNGNLNSVADLQLTLPEDIVPGSSQAFVKLYPSGFSQLVEGLDAIFQMPYGCFEQTSSTTYPNVLALDYLRANRLNQPQIEAKARQYIHLGYQRLLTFEVPGGGFDWYGNPPAKLTLTAYGLMEFQDMARVHDVDPALIERTRAWLLSQRNPNGSWDRPKRNFGTVGLVNHNAVATTAYVSWAVFAQNKSGGEETLAWLLQFPADAIESPYLLSLMIHAIHAIDPACAKLPEYSDRLLELQRSDPEKDLVWWAQEQHGQTMFYGQGRSGDCETTALAALALLKLKTQPNTAGRALNWLVSQKDARGTWYSTQATILALKALIAGSDAPVGGQEGRVVQLAWDGEALPDIAIPADQSDVVQLRDCSTYLHPGDNRLRLAETEAVGTSYQVVMRYYVPADETPTPESPLTIDLAYDRDQLEVDQHVNALATVTNVSDQTAPMVMLDLPIPGGFRALPDDFIELQGSRKIAKFEISKRQVIVYLLQLAPDETLKLNYRLRATMPVNVTAPAGQVYEYYDPDKRGSSRTSNLRVTAPDPREA